MRARSIALGLVVVLGVVSPSCAPGPARPMVGTPALARGSDGSPERLGQNLWLVGDGVISGPEPGLVGGAEGLRGMGVRSVLSVDGARPDVGAFERAGIGVAHVPIGYDGVEDDELGAIVRAVRDLPRPIYVHCHHGKHRGPTAAALGLIGTGELTVDGGARVQRSCGTSASYPGLWSAVRGASALAGEAIDAAPIAPGVAPVGTFVEGMATIDRAYDRLKLIRASGWATPEDHPDLVPAAEAGMVADLLRALAADEDARGRGSAFVRDMHASSAEASALEAALGRGDREVAERSWVALAASCKACHTGERD